MDSDFNYDTLTYKLITSPILNKTIKKINDIDVPCDSDPTEITSSYKQFVDLLNRFIRRFNNDFFTLKNEYGITIKTIIETNYRQMENYLLSKHYLGDNAYIDFFNESINRIIISNFIKNKEYIPKLNSLLEKKGIAIKNYKEYSLEEVMKIEELMTDIAFCVNDSFKSFNLFEDIGYVINNRIKKDKNNNREPNYYIYYGTRHYRQMYDDMLKKYYRSEQYLKYFKW